MTQVAPQQFDVSSEVQYESLDFLVQEISTRCHWTVSPLQVAALLESLGVTDVVAQQRYGYADVFVLANKIMGRLPRTYHDQDSEVDAGRHTAVKPHTQVEIKPESWREKLSDYVRGVASLLPMVILSAGIILHQLVGNWNPYQVWMVGIAMLLSLLVTGGFMQAASRRGSIYLSQGYVDAAQRIIFRIMALCLFVVFLVALLMAAVGLGSQLVTMGDVQIMVVAFMSLSLVWLGASLLYLLDQAQLFLLALLAGVGSGALMLTLGGALPLPYEVLAVAAVGIGLLLFMAITAVSARYALSKLSQASAVGNQMVLLPTSAHLTISLLPYFLYGA
ncbi:MAG: hypothetical protein KDD89_14200, partial [Anaerolineales bacterium]|nr:hypothetical protein [Anaerolineales bacterium]